jgi:hypothetical protein
VPQLARSPLARIQPCRRDDLAEGTPDVRGVGWRADSRRQHQIVVMPCTARGPPYFFLTGLMVAQRIDTALRKF